MAPRSLPVLFPLVLSLIFGGATAAPGDPAPPAPAAPAARPPIESFFENPLFTGAELSPDARSLAIRIGGKDRRDALAVFDLGTNSIKAVASFRDVDVGHFQWVNNDRLAFDTVDKHLGQGDRRFAPGLYAVNRDGSQLLQLASRTAMGHSGVRRMQPWNTFLVRQKGSQDSEFVYVTSPMADGPGQLEYVNLLKLNTLTGRATTVNRPGKARSWLLDHKGEPRIVTTVDEDTAAIFYRDPATDQWRKLTEFHAYTGSGNTFSPLAFGPDGTLYVTTRATGDKLSVHRYDLATGKLDRAPLVTVKDYDFRGTLITNRDKLLGMRVLADGDLTEWFDPAMKALQQRVDGLLPGSVNLLTPAARAATPWVLVVSYSDVLPHVYSLFNSETGAFNKVGDTHDKIDPRQMGNQDIVRYKARDGLDIPAWLTVPRGSGKNLPLVVLVHGGPFARGKQWGWSADSQFLASRGYAVLEPEFRGSTGFGYKHFQAGWKQWGLAMQNDIADGARWAIAQGIADPKRICIAGASYGGYATLMGLLNDPDLFKCGINWVGVTDIKLMYTGHWSALSDLSDGYKQHGMPTLVGDLVKDAEQLKATSPLEHAARIRQPLLLAYGGADLRVPLYHGKKFYHAVKATNPNVEWVVYDDEGHGWQVPKNRIDFWGRVERFLDRNIGKP